MFLFTDHGSREPFKMKLLVCKHVKGFYVAIYYKKFVTCKNLKTLIYIFARFYNPMALLKSGFYALASILPILKYGSTLCLY